MSDHLNEIKPITGRRRIFKSSQFNLTIARKITFDAQSQKILERKFEDPQLEIIPCCWIFTPQKLFETETVLLVSSALITATETNTVFSPVINFHTDPFRIKTAVAQINIKNFPRVTKTSKCFSRYCTICKNERWVNYLAENNKLKEIPNTQQIEKRATEYENFWYPTPENYPDISCLLNRQKTGLW